MAAKDRPVVGLDHLAKEWMEYQKLLEWRADADRRLKELQTLFETAITVAGGEIATVFGTPTFSYYGQNRYAWAKWVEANPELAHTYTVPDPTATRLDKARIARLHPDTLKEFQVFAFGLVQNTKTG